MHPQDITNYVPFHRGSVFFCLGCFKTCNDPSQHMNKAQACGNGIAIGYIATLYELNFITEPDFVLNVVVVANMLEDETCPVCPRDIMAQAVTWDPSTNFSAVTDKGHTVSAVLANTSFHTLYKDYVLANPTISVTNPNFIHEAAKRSKNIKQYPQKLHLLIQRHVDDAVNAEIERRVREGKLLLPGAPGPANPV